MIGRLATATIRFWRGDTPLADAFWNWAFFGGLAVNLSSSALFLWFVGAERPILAAIAGYAYSVPYNLYVIVGVWRAADRYPGERLWAEMARWITLAAMVLLSVT